MSITSEYEVVTRREVDWVISRPDYALKVVWLPASDAQVWRELVRENTYGRVLPLLLLLGTLIVSTISIVVFAGWAAATYGIAMTGGACMVVMLLMGWRDQVSLKRIEPQLRSLLPETYASIPVSNINAWPGPGERNKATHVIMPCSE